MRIFILATAAMLILSCDNTQKKIVYPETKKCDTINEYFGTKVEDPYSWLEDDNSDETKAWVIEQNKVTYAYLEKLPMREKFKNRLTELWNYPKSGVPYKKGERYFYSKNDGLQNQSVFYVKDSDGTERVLIDPNKLSENGTVALGGLEIDKTGTHIAYMLNESGSDWNTIYVKDIATGENLKDELKWIKFSNIAWYKDGFFYSRYDEPKSNVLTSKNEFHKIYYHKLGDAQENDKLTFDDKLNPMRSCRAYVTQDDNYLIVYQSQSTSGEMVYVKNLSKNSDFNKLNNDFDNNWSVIACINDMLYISTDFEASNKRIVKVSAQKPSASNLEVVIPEQKSVINDVDYLGGKLFITYLKDAKSEVKIYNTEGKEEGEIKLPSLGTISGISGKHNENEAYFAFTSFTFPTVVYKYDIASNTYTDYFKPQINFDFDKYETKQIFYTSKDGTKVPMFIVHKKGIELNGENPTLLYGYGGFTVSLTPSFSISRLIWLENGGVYVIANIRGGGEYGDAWHKAGTKMNKQNVFDDFISAAEYLISEKYTSPEKLAINGGSNGGLLIGAVTNQRPDLFAAAIPQVGVMDMLRYQKFTIGWAWAGDYGTSADSEEMFKYLYKYSPLHNIKNDIDYPAVMVMTSDHDDRVVPAHSFKYAAQLQAMQKDRKNAALIRIQTNAGHGAGKSTSVSIQESADIYSFLWENLGMK